MGHQKMEFHILDIGFFGLPSSFTVQYNPKQHSEQRGATYKPHEGIGQGGGQQEYTNTGARRISFELLFDTTQEETVRDVRDAWVEPLQRLMDRCVPIEGEGQAEKLRPPLVSLIWGRELLTGHVESVKADFIFYGETGAPLRARVAVSLVESRPPAASCRGGSLSHLSAEGVQLVFPAGGTANQLAARLGADYRQLLADNDIDDPMNLSPEQVLRITRAARRIHYKAEAERRIAQDRWAPGYSEDE